MANKDYSEDLLIQAPTAEFLEKKLGWETVFAQDEGERWARTACWADPPTTRWCSAGR
jgi:hypothetical protein